MKAVACFQKVSFEEFSRHFDNPEAAGAAYEVIRIPTRATVGSAGYDFVTPVAIRLQPGQSVLIPTGIRAKIEAGWVLQIFPKSGLGFRFRLQLDNTVGIIDQDYYNSDNEGHIMVKLTCDAKSDATLSLPAGKAFVQGIFLPFGITEDDDALGVRNGGFGSTGR